MLLIANKLRLAGALLIITVMLATSIPTPAFAQDDPEPTGTLVVNTFECLREDQEPGTITLTPEGGLAGFVCTPNGQVQITVDGEPVTFANGESLDLAVGPHSLVETSQGSSLDIEITDGATTIVEVSFAVAPAPTETPLPTETETAEPTATNTAEPSATATETATPARNQITIIAHLCPDTITSRRDFDALPDHWARINVCHSIVLPGDEPIPDGLTSGERDFTIIVEGADDVTQSIADAQFEPHLVCEHDLEIDVDGNPATDICLDLSRYLFEDVTQGAVTVRASDAPTETRFVGVSYDPRTTDEDTETSVGSQGTIKLNTTDDGDVTVHVFYGPVPPPTATRTPTPVPTVTSTRPASTATRTSTPFAPTSTPIPGSTATATRIPATPTPTSDDPTATRTPAPNTPTPVSGGGSIQVYKLACEGPESLTRITVLAPGEDATRDDLGDATCFGGNTVFQLTDGSGNPVRTIDVPTSGILLVSGIAAGTYNIEDTQTSVTARLEVDAATTTRVISLFYEDIGDIIDDEPPVIPEITIEDPDEVPTAPPFEEDPEFAFDGPVAVPSDADPFTVVDDPEAETRVNAIDSFESLPGVGIGPSKHSSHSPLTWLFLMSMLLFGFAALSRRRSHQDR